MIQLWLSGHYRSWALHKENSGGLILLANSSGRISGRAMGVFRIAGDGGGYRLIDVSLGGRPNLIGEGQQLWITLCEMLTS